VSKGSGGLVLVRDIDFASTSAATLLPFHGRAHIAYVPARGVVLGLSKLARLTKLAARRVQSQEELTARLLRVLCAQLRPAGVAVVVDARHLSYAAPAPAARATAAAAGSLAAGGADGAGLLSEALAMLGVDEAGLDLQLVGAGCGAAACCGAGCKHGGGDEEEQQQQQQQRAARPGSPGGDSDAPLAPVTPDPSERDDASSGCGDAEAEADADGAPEAAAAPRACSSCASDDADAVGGMEAAVVGLLAEAGVPGAAGPALRAGVRRYVMSLLAATSGYHSELPLARPPHSPACWAARRRQQQQQEETGQRRRESQQQRGPSDPHHTQQQKQQSQQQQPPWREHHVPFVSQCEHHMLPFYGSVHIAYMPAACGCGGGGGGGGGLSDEDAAQVVAVFTRRLQVQERITQQVADAVGALTGARGVLVAVRAAHMCMVARGVENHAGTTLTRAAAGEFEARPDLRMRFLRAVAARGDGAEAGAGAGAAGAACTCACGR
jgi:GTP cyclohydrolase I